MAAITASLERSLQNCSLNQTSRSNRRGGGGGGGGISLSSSSDIPESNNHHSYNNRRPHESDSHDDEEIVHSNASSSDDNSTFVDLNSHVSLPYHWEQCLDLKTGELYYINWSTGMKAKEDPRTTAGGYNGDYYSDEEEDDNEKDESGESSPYDSEGSSTTESSSCSRTRQNLRSVKKVMPPRHQPQAQFSQDSVLVVAGCKSCLMYYMVPKHVEECPKCSGQLLHFGANNSSSP